MRTLRMPGTSCPWCNHTLDACSTFGLDSPNAGDLSVCVKCAGLLIFDKQLIAQKLEPAQLLEIATEDYVAYQSVISLQSAIRGRIEK